MKDLNMGNGMKSPKVSKTMQTLLDIKKGKSPNIALKNLKKFDNEFKTVKTLANDFRDNKVSKEKFNSDMNVSEKLISGVLHDNYFQKFGVKSYAVVHINRISTDEDKEYEIAIGEDGNDARFEKFGTVDDVLDRMKDLVS